MSLQLIEYRILLQGGYYDTLLRFPNNEEIKIYMDFLVRCFEYFENLQSNSQKQIYKQTQVGDKLITQTKIILCKNFDNHKKLFNIIIGYQLSWEDLKSVSNLMIKYKIKEFPYQFTICLIENFSSIDEDIIQILKKSPKTNIIYQFLIWLLDNKEVCTIKGLFKIIEGKYLPNKESKEKFIIQLKSWLTKENKKFPPSIQQKLHIILMEKREPTADVIWTKLYELVFNRMDGLVNLKPEIRKHWGYYIIHKLPAPYYQRIINKLLWDRPDIVRRKLIVEAREHKYSKKINDNNNQTNSDVRQIGINNKKNN